MKRIPLLILPFLLATAGCLQKPAGPTVDVDELLFSWGALKAYFLFQESLPADPLAFASPQELFASVQEPYTEYYSPEEGRQFLSLLETSEPAAIGIFIRFAGDTVLVDHVVKGSPGDLAGLKRLDTLLAANGVSLTGLADKRRQELLSGVTSDTIAFDLKRDTLLLHRTVTLAPVLFPAVYADTLDPANKIYYLSLMIFTDTAAAPGGTAGEFREVLSGIDTNGATVLDLRGNPGGILEHSLAVARDFLDAGDTVIRRHFRDVDDITGLPVAGDSVHRADSTGPAARRKFVTLIDEHSASAAEILAAALHDNRPDIPLMGRTTYGKARGQVIGFTPLGGLWKITSMALQTAKGVDYNEVGIAPAIPLASGADWIAAARAQALTLLSKRHLGKAQAADVELRLRAVEFNRNLMRRAWRGPLPYSKPSR